MCTCNSSCRAPVIEQKLSELHTKAHDMVSAVDKSIDSVLPPATEDGSEQRGGMSSSLALWCCEVFFRLCAFLDARGIVLIMVDMPLMLINRRDRRQGGGGRRGDQSSG